MFEFIRKSPLGFAFATAALVLTVSPEARQATRKIAVKGMTVLLDWVDQARSTAAIAPPSTLNHEFANEAYPNTYLPMSGVSQAQGSLPTSSQTTNSVKENDIIP